MKKNIRFFALRKKNKKSQCGGGGPMHHLGTRGQVKVKCEEAGL